MDDTADDWIDEELPAIVAVNPVVTPYWEMKKALTESQHDNGSAI